MVAPNYQRVRLYGGPLDGEAFLVVGTEAASAYIVLGYVKAEALDGKPGHEVPVYAIDLSPAGVACEDFRNRPLRYALARRRGIFTDYAFTPDTQGAPAHDR